MLELRAGRGRKRSSGIYPAASPQQAAARVLCLAQMLLHLFCLFSTEAKQLWGYGGKAGELWGLDPGQALPWGGTWGCSALREVPDAEFWRGEGTAGAPFGAKIPRLCAP